MIFDFEHCKTVFLTAILSGLRHSQNTIEQIELRNPPTGPRRDVTAISFDVSPWHRGIGLALRDHNEHWGTEELRYNSADWKMSVIEPSGIRIAEYAAAESYIGDLYDEAAQINSALEIAHLIFLAAIEALVDPAVTESLRSNFINAPFVGDGFVTDRTFEYIVCDSDGTIRANYYDILMSRRAVERTRRLIEIRNF
jgi:hypothetical protein